MSQLIDCEYISLLSSRLEGFSSKRQGVWNCRCPLCGDSSKSKRKKRFYFYTKKGTYMVRCHNCGYSQRFNFFLKEFDYELFKDYCLALFNDNKREKEHIETRHIKNIAEDQRLKRLTIGIDYSPLTRFENLPKSHPARQYVENRMLPLDRLRYAPKFNEFLITTELDSYLKDKFAHLDIPVIVIPFWWKKNHSRVFQIRTFDPKFKPKYITFKMDESDLKIFGIDRINPHKPVYILEGPFDSMCLPNSVAVSGMSSELPESIKSLNVKVYFLDNEPRNKDVCRQLQKLIKFGERVVILSDIYEHNDVNDMVKAGIDVEQIFKKHTYCGATAQLKFNKWKRV